MQNSLAVADLYEEHFHPVFRVCRAILSDPDDAADAAHDVFARAMGHSDSWQTPQHARAWLLAVARTRSIDVLRRRQRLDRALLKVGTASETAPDPERVTVDRDLVRAVLGPLSPRDRLLLWQAVVEHRPLTDIASNLKLTYEAAAQALHRARRRAGVIAARVAVVTALIRVTRVLRRASPISIPAHPALLLFFVPMVVVSLQSSGRTPAVAAAPATQTAHRHPAAATHSVVQPSISPAPATNPSGQPPASAGTALTPMPSLPVSPDVIGMAHRITQGPLQTSPLVTAVTTTLPISPTVPPLPIPTPDLTDFPAAPR